MSLYFPTISFGGPSAKAMGTCMADSMTGKERKQMAKWFFFAMSNHPEIKDFSNISEQSKENADKFIAALITRLLTEDCLMETKAALEESSESIKQAFELIGRVAAQEILLSPDVKTGASNFEQYLDKDKINARIHQK
jgi:hypothetical protein